MFNNPKLILQSWRQLNDLVTWQLNEAMIIGNREKIENWKPTVDLCAELLARYMALCGFHPCPNVQIWAGQHLYEYQEMRTRHLWESGVMLN